MTGHSTAIMLMDIQSQTGNRKKLQVQGKYNSKDKLKNKSNEKHLETLFTHRHILNIHLHNVPVILDLTDKRTWIAFQVQPVN